jgi:dienelactone hydrolase family protein
MASFWESTKVDGADMRLYVSVPGGAGPFPAVVVIQHQGGVDEFMEEMTQRVASAGYAGVLCKAPGPDHRGCQVRGGRLLLPRRQLLAKVAAGCRRGQARNVAMVANSSAS